MDDCDGFPVAHASTDRAGHPYQINVAAGREQDDHEPHQSMVPHSWY
jgi:hypothetical protein